MAAQPSLFANQRQPQRARAARPHATADAEAMARRRHSRLDLFPGAAMLGYVERPVDTPVEAMTRYLPLIGQPPERLDVKPGANPGEVELRLIGEQRGFHPHHLLAVIEGLTLDEARTALARLRA